MIFGVCAVTVLTLAVGGPAAAADRPPTDTIGDTANAAEVVGRVFQAGTDSVPVPVVDVRLIQADGRLAGVAQTDQGGRFRMTVPRPGRFVVEVSRIGYRDHTSEPFAVGADETVELTVWIAALPVTLDEIRVRAKRQAPAEFWERRERLADRGVFITRSEIEEVSHPRLSLILHKAPLVHGDWTGAWHTDITFTPPGGGTTRCSPLTYVNGVLLPEYPPLSEWIDFTDLVGVEVYRSISFAPERYRSRWGCGVVLLWTRPSPDRGPPWVPVGVSIALMVLVRALVP